MKTMKSIAKLAIFSALFASPAAADEYSIDWSVIAGGGAMFSEAGEYSLSATIGQALAGEAMIGGEYRVVGGFWSLPVTPPPCLGDVNGDGSVTLSDLSTLLAHFGVAEDAAATDGDLDADGDVDLADLSRLLANFGTIC